MKSQDCGVADFKSALGVGNPVELPRVLLPEFGFWESLSLLTVRMGSGASRLLTHTCSPTSRCGGGEGCLPLWSKTASVSNLELSWVQLCCVFSEIDTAVWQALSVRCDLLLHF